MSAGTASYSVSIRFKTETGAAKTEVKSFESSLKKMTTTVQHMGRGLERFGRTMSITGFVMGIVARRLITSFTGIAKSILSIVEESAGLDKSLSFLSDTLSALGLAGMLTDDKMEEVLSVFNRMMNNGITLGGILADLKLKFEAIKTAVTEGAITPLSNLNKALDDVDWSVLQEGVSNATTNFLTPLTNKIIEIIGDEGTGGILRIKKVLEDLGTLGGTFGAGLLQGFWDLAQAVSDLLGISETVYEDDDKISKFNRSWADGADVAIGKEQGKTGLLGIVYSLGEIVAKAGAAGIALTVFGLVLGPLGSIISGLAGLIGGPATLALAVVVASIILDFDEWKASVVGLKGSLDELAQTLGVGSVLDLAWTYMGTQIKRIGLIVRGVIDLISLLINNIGLAINKLKELASWGAATTVGPQGSLSGNILGQKQGGGFIARTGNYLLHEGEQVLSRNQVNNAWNPTFYITGDNPRAIAEEVDRILSQRSRSPYMTR